MEFWAFPRLSRCATLLGRMDSAVPSVDLIILAGPTTPAAAGVIICSVLSWVPGGPHSRRASPQAQVAATLVTMWRRLHGVAIPSLVPLERISTDAGPLMLVDLITQQSSRLVVPVYQRPYSWSEENPGNRVGRDFAARLPNFLWLTDVTRFSIPAGKPCLGPVPDCFDGSVVSRVSRPPRTRRWPTACSGRRSPPPPRRSAPAL